MKKYSTFVYLVKSFDPSVIHSNLFSGTGNFEARLTEPETGASPSDQTISNILGFAQSYNVLKTKNLGHVELNLN